MKIGVICGGLSSEREVSLRTGDAIFRALLKKGYNVVKIDMDRNIAETLKKENIDFAFIALHGKYGEDGAIQGLLEIMDIPYTGSGILASSLAIDKIMTKKILKAEGIPTPNYIAFSFDENPNFEAISSEILQTLKLPVVIKAPREGSTIGIEFVFSKQELPKAIKKVLEIDKQLLVEEFIEGVEVTASVLGNSNPVVLPLIEIVSKTRFYDYEAKYTPGLSEHIIPPRIAPELSQKAIEYARKTYKALGCRGFARVDFMIDVRKNEAYVLEVNTIPGMTATSLFPDAAKAQGISFEDLVEKILMLGLEGRQK
ncbi:D-alanine--D-alanine ligase [Carboxydothermus hydrogenoformans]|uniref:D-alanine--D-alanine ligase n=2 Tax=Carboxydothermus TaxID=129957 RepID=DDL_CARHZ|nr:D-alanine--D-alanine ligase [Carboxydothermus hydrogenoformans]Q3ACF5.1 RecName: Full=D-alanine--D-alanine ligase; AltName: Full=D-Ala-D-Ala ligase; AltName: Full=D-alanylalanine synthetase [Carboxydothermus hydrogenoformans Z-2901]ABB14185.1 D-alanine--D-alanine ligase [Carboxydothermus hydrogenoformans Z-2901]